MMRLNVSEIVFSVFEERAIGHGLLLGEVRCRFDSDETAWVEADQRLVVTDEMVSALAEKLREHGIIWMRGWHEAGWKGRVISPAWARGPDDVGAVYDGFGLEDSGGA